MKIFDVIFWFVGRWTHRGLSKMGLFKEEFSDGGYVALGLLVVILPVLLLFLIL
jgi:hypothetical protein